MTNYNRFSKTYMDSIYVIEDANVSGKGKTTDSRFSGHDEIEADISNYASLYTPPGWIPDKNRLGNDFLRDHQFSMPIDTG